MAKVIAHTPVSTSCLYTRTKKNINIATKPDRLKGEEIPLTARILRIVDIYDALATDRPYRKAIQPEEVFSIMHGEARRGWWDDSLICEFQSMIMKTP